MQTHAWDVLMAVFVAPDRVQHYFWPQDSSSVETQTWEPIRLLYQQIDRFLASALQLVDDDTTVILLSDHGFAPAKAAVKLLNPLFERLGLLSYHSGIERIRNRLSTRLVRWARRTVPRRTGAALTAIFPRLAHAAANEHLYSSIDWPRTGVFATYTGGTVVVNLAGRQLGGIVPPDEYDSVCERVRDILMNLSDPLTGDPLVQAVGRREELYDGPYLDQAADLTIRWNIEALRDSLGYRAEGLQVVVRKSDRVDIDASWTAFHSYDGVFVAHGPGVKKGALIEGATLYDITPTTLHLQGLPVPEDMEGQVLTDLFTEYYLRRHPVLRSEATTDGKPMSGSHLDDDETRQIEERLRGLGYIE
jgi:predicted AlkP superfamily phosphohydrolase/phosphomutase